MFGGFKARVAQSNSEDGCRSVGSGCSRALQYSVSDVDKPGCSSACMKQVTSAACYEHGFT